MQFIPGEQGYIGGAGTDSEQTCGVQIGCYQCGTPTYPKLHRILPGLQWTCGHATWGPVTRRSLRSWELWFASGKNRPFWMTVDESFKIPVAHRIFADEL